MPVLSAAGFRAQLAAGQTGPLYVLVGADEQEKSAVAAELTDTVDEGLRAFNVDRLYGGDAKVDTLLDSANTLPMMAPRRVVIVFEAEKLLVPKRESKAAEADQQRLEAFVQAPAPQATVAFVCGALDMRRRLVKLLLKEAQVVDCGTITDAADAERWVKARATRQGLTLEPAALRALIDRTGLDIVRLRAALERLALYTMGQAAVTAEDIRQAVPAGPEAQADFGIANAVAQGDAAAALRELNLALNAGAMPVMLMGQLRFAAEKLPGRQLLAGVDAVFRTDVALKSSGGDPRILLERLVVELCGSGRRPAPRSGYGPAGPGTRPGERVRR